jgi:hypothetical protein
MAPSGKSFVQPGHASSLLAVSLVRRDADSCVLALSGELSSRSAGAASDAVSKALIDVGRVLVDVSGLRVSRPETVRVFSSTLTAAGGWPRVRLVLFGAGAGLGRSLAAMRVSETVPLAPDEITARQISQRRPPAVVGHLDLSEEEGLLAPRRARLFVKEACADWQLSSVCDDAMLVASELVENAVSHAHKAGELNLRLDELGLTVSVRDDDYRGLVIPLAIDSAGRRRHGLFLVAAISRTWGVSPTENGKSVWALLPVEDRVNNAPGRGVGLSCPRSPVLASASSSGTGHPPASGVT